MPVEQKNQSLKEAEYDLNLVATLWGGTKAMRDAGKTYLPQEPGEEKKDYENRRDRSTLTNIFKKTINTYAGRIFADPVTVINQSGFESFIENVDLEGRNLHRFGYDITRYALRDGLRFLLVEAPSSDGVKTRDDELKAGIRPYFVEIDVRNVLGWKTKVIGAQKVLTQFRYIEIVSLDVDEFSQATVEQIRVIEPNLVRLYRKDGKGNWYQFQEILTTIDFVPVVPVFADRHGFWEAVPPLMDLAWLNIEHWQKLSDHNNILHVARVPILHWAGYQQSVDADGNNVDLTVGPNTLAKSANPQATLAYVEITGAGSIDVGMRDTQMLEDRMVAMGAEYAVPKKQNAITATEKNIDESGDISELEAFAQNLKDSLELAMQMVAVMQGGAFTGEVSLNTQLSETASPVNVDGLIKIRAMRDISREGMYEILNAEWGTSLELDKEQQRLNSEPLELSAEPLGVE